MHGKSLPITGSYPELLQIEAYHCIRGKLELNQGSDLGLLAFRDYILNTIMISPVVSYDTHLKSAYVIFVSRAIL